MKTKAEKMSNDEKVRERVIAKVRETKQPTTGHTRTRKYYAWICNNAIRVLTESNDSEVEMLYNDEFVEL